MPKPLEVDVREPKTAWSGFCDSVIGAMVVLTIGAFGYFSWRKAPFHFENPHLNILAHVLLVILPAIGGAAVFSRPLRFKPSDEKPLGVATYFSTLKHDWWTSLLLWVPLAAVLTLIGMKAPELFAELASRQTRLGSCAITAVLSFATAGLFCSMITDRPEIRVSAEGFRLSLMTFYEWTQINRVVLLGDTFEIYHQASPRVPVVHVQLKDSQARETFSNLLTHHNIPTSRDRGNLNMMRLFVLLAASIIFVGGVSVYWATKWDIRWIYAGMVAISMVATLFFERFRGIPKVSKVKPKVDYSEMSND